MSFLAKLGLIQQESREETETPISSSVTTSAPSTPATTSPEVSMPSKPIDVSVFSAPSTSSQVGSSPEDPQKASAVKELFQKILDNANLQGMDYYEFRKALQDLNSMGDAGMSEVQQYRSVFVAFKTQGCDVPRLVESANFYLSTLEQEKKDIDGAIAQKKAQDIDGIKTQIELLDQQNEDINKHIEELRKQITANQEQVFALQNQMDTNARTLRERESLVNMEYQRIIGEINADIQRINQYLTSTKA